MTNEAALHEALQVVIMQGEQAVWLLCVVAGFALCGAVMAFWPKG